MNALCCFLCHQGQVPEKNLFQIVHDQNESSHVNEVIHEECLVQLAIAQVQNYFENPQSFPSVTRESFCCFHCPSAACNVVCDLSQVGREAVLKTIDAMYREREDELSDDISNKKWNAVRELLHAQLFGETAWISQNVLEEVVVDAARNEAPSDVLACLLQHGPLSSETLGDVLIELFQFANENQAEQIVEALLRNEGDSIDEGDLGAAYLYAFENGFYDIMVQLRAYAYRTYENGFQGIIAQLRTYTNEIGYLIPQEYLENADVTIVPSDGNESLSVISGATMHINNI